MNKKNVVTIALIGLVFLVGAFMIVFKYGIMGGRTDKAEAQNIEWIRQFGTSLDDRAEDVAADTSGNIYVVGRTNGTLPGQSSSGEDDAFIRKYDSGGTELWTRQFGTSATDEAWGVSIDSSGNIYVVGDTEGTLPGQSSSGEADAFIRKYDAGGAELWTRQFGTSKFDWAQGVAVVSSGTNAGVYVSGSTSGTFEDQVWVGSSDAFIRKYDFSGNESWTRQFGSLGFEYAYVSADSSGIYVAGVTGGTLPGQTSFGDIDAYIRKYNAGGTEQWTRQFGTSTGDTARSVSTDSSGNIYVVGDTDGTLPGQSPIQGSYDAYIRKYNAGGTEQWTRQFGTSAGDLAECVSVDSSGIYIAGYTWGTFPGQTSSGEDDAFIRKYDADGNMGWTKQFGTSNDDYALGVSAVPSGVYVAGSTTGTLGQTYQGASDAFIAKILHKLIATVDVAPQQLVRKSKMKWITAYIELPEGYDVNDIDVSSVKLNDTVNGVVAEPKPSAVGDHDVDGVPDLMVKFDKAAVTALIPSGATTFTATINGSLNGIVFEGSDTINVK